MGRRRAIHFRSVARPIIFVSRCLKFCLKRCSIGGVDIDAGIGECGFLVNEGGQSKRSKPAIKK
jgi:hypothetical protein